LSNTVLTVLEDFDGFRETTGTADPPRYKGHQWVEHGMLA